MKALSARKFTQLDDLYSRWLRALSLSRARTCVRSAVALSLALSLSPAVAGPTGAFALSRSSSHDDQHSGPVLLCQVALKVPILQKAFTSQCRLDSKISSSKISSS